MVNLAHLKIFYHVAKHLSFTEAAKDLSITQPAVTNQIKSFEDCWSLKLFQKKGRRIDLTPVGKVLYTHAQKLFQCEKDIQDILMDFKSLKFGVLHVGTSKTYARSLMPILIGRFLDAHPHIIVNLDEGGSSDIFDNLLNFRNEVGILAKTGDHPEVFFLPLWREELVVILPLDHPLAQKKTVALEEIADEPIIIREKGSATRQIISQIFAQKKYILHILAESSSIEFIKNLVSRGDGISIITKEAACFESQEKGFAIAHLRDQRISLEISVAYLKNHQLSPAGEEFVDFLKQYKRRFNSTAVL